VAWALNSRCRADERRGPDDEPVSWNCKGARSFGASGEPRPIYRARGRGSTGTARERLPALASLSAQGWLC
jgi:hypothetical protein